MISVLHTWGSNLHYHPHLHCIVPCGGLDNNGMWKKLSSSGKESPFLFPVKAMSKVFRAKFMAALTRQADVTPQIRKKLFRTEWIVYSKSPFCGAGKVLEYLGEVLTPGSYQ
ncbi:transposase [Candidatus Bacteroides intestinigallinarum]|nr:transposase [Candidatus Bacteroides intestinigallinarum]MCS3202160.1 transposase [Candidatus Bacteroides intestinigallinarum]